MGWNIAIVFSNSDCDPKLCNSQRLIGNGEDNSILYRYQQFLSLGGHHSISSGGGAEVFVADKLFISTQLGGALKILLHVKNIQNINYLSQADSARIIFFKNRAYSSRPPLLIKWWSHYVIITLSGCIISLHEVGYDSTIVFLVNIRC